PGGCSRPRKDRRVLPPRYFWPLILLVTERQYEVRGSQQRGTSHWTHTRLAPASSSWGLFLRRRPTRSATSRGWLLFGDPRGRRTSPTVCHLRPWTFAVCLPSPRLTRQSAACEREDGCKSRRTATRNIRGVLALRSIA